MMPLSSIGSTGEDANGPHYEHELYKFLIATRQTIEAAPEAFIQATGGNPSDTIRMLDYAIQYWYTDKRDEALGQLEKNEEALNTLAGFGAFNAVQITGTNEAELYGDDDAHEIILSGLGRAKGKQKKPSKFFSGIKKAVKKINVGKALVRFNPATIAIRNGFLLALKLNIGKMSEKMKWAYATPQQIAAKRISPQQVAAAKRAVEQGGKEVHQARRQSGEYAQGYSWREEREAERAWAAWRCTTGCRPCSSRSVHQNGDGRAEKELA